MSETDNGKTREFIRRIENLFQWNWGNNVISWLGA